jgi:hypothetical protein
LLWCGWLATSMSELCGVDSTTTPNAESVALARASLDRDGHITASLTTTTQNAVGYTALRRLSNSTGSDAASAVASFDCSRPRRSAQRRPARPHRRPSAVAKRRAGVSVPPASGERLRFGHRRVTSPSLARPANLGAKRLIHRSGRGQSRKPQLSAPRSSDETVRAQITPAPDRRSASRRLGPPTRAARCSTATTTTSRTWTRPTSGRGIIDGPTLAPLCSRESLIATSDQNGASWPPAGTCS